MDTPRILVVDDEPQIGRMLRTQLEPRGYRVQHVTDGGAALLAIGEQPPHLVLLDMGLPDITGLEVCRRVREWSRVPIIFVSVRDEQSAIIEALDTGADDYVTKPFGMPELVARIRAVLRRQRSLASPEALFASGELRADFTARRVTVSGAEVHLTPTEYKLLRVLIRNADRTVRHGELLREIWGPGAESQTCYLHVYLRQLRRKLEPSAHQPRHLVTEPGVGYRFRTRE